MLSKLLALLIACAVCLTALPLTRAATHGGSDKRNRFAEKVKAGITKLGVGPDALVNVKLRDKSKLSGYVSEANETTFVITNANAGTTTVVAYADVVQVKGNNLSTGQKIVIVAAVVGVIAAILVALTAGKN